MSKGNGTSGREGKGIAPMEIKKRADTDADTDTGP